MFLDNSKKGFLGSILLCKNVHLKSYCSKSEDMLNHITGVIDACFLLILFVMDSLHNRLSLKIALVGFRNFFLRENCWCWLGFEAKLSSTWWHVPIISVIVISSRIPPNFGTPSNFFCLRESLWPELLNFVQIMMAFFSSKILLQLEQTILVFPVSQ